MGNFPNCFSNEVNIRLFHKKTGVEELYKIVLHPSEIFMPKTKTPGKPHDLKFHVVVN